MLLGIQATPMATLWTMDSFWMFWVLFSTISSSRPMLRAQPFSSSAGALRCANLMTPAGRSIRALRAFATTMSDRCFSACKCMQVQDQLTSLAVPSSNFKANAVITRAGRSIHALRDLARCMLLSLRRQCAPHSHPELSNQLECRCLSTLPCRLTTSLHLEQVCPKHGITATIRVTMSTGRSICSDEMRERLPQRQEDPAAVPAEPQ